MGNKVGIEFSVDNALCNNLTFEDGTPVKAMPTEYYSLAANQIFLDKTMSGAVKVQLNDAFLRRRGSSDQHVCHPVANDGCGWCRFDIAGHAKDGKCREDESCRLMWLPKTMCSIASSSSNPWTGTYLRRGVDMVSGNGQTKTTVRHKKSVEDDDLISTTTKSMKSIVAIQFACNLLAHFR